MTDGDQARHRRTLGVLGGRILLLMFGLSVLAFLIVIERAQQALPVPATGSVIAMASAASSGAMDAKTGKSVTAP